MTKTIKERLPSTGGSEKGKKIWEEGRKKPPSPDLIKSIEDSQKPETPRDQENDRAARGTTPEKTI